jgi:hypothetical protein
MLKSVFPAAVIDPVNRRTWYFSGDFAANKVNFCTSKIKGFDRLKLFLYSDKPDDPKRFFWLYYKPLLNTILNEYYATLNSR